MQINDRAILWVAFDAVDRAEKDPRMLAEERLRTLRFEDDGSGNRRIERRHFRVQNRHSVSSTKRREIGNSAVRLRTLQDVPEVGQAAIHISDFLARGEHRLQAQDEFRFMNRLCEEVIRSGLNRTFNIGHLVECGNH